ncbi:MAG: T9SS type A sorting domain-containing protein [Bacteroidetes bacterium]|nr:T9SS type A sorting domain-containing protein [Bacteroidota bacterium]
MEKFVKNILQKSLIALTALLMAVPTFAQNYNLNPDSVYHDSHSNYWSVYNTYNQTALYGFNGNLFLITLQTQFTGKSPTVFTIDNTGHLAAYNMKPNNKNYFLYGYEDETDYYSGTQGQSIPFEYDGQFWHYHNYMKWSTAFSKTDDSYDCFARFPGSATEPYHAYYDAVKGKPTVIKKGAFQHDSTLYFLGVYAQSSDPNYGKWCVQKYEYDKVNQKFIWKKNVLVSGIPGNMLGGIVAHTDTSGATRLVINTYSPNNTGTYLGYLNATTPAGGETTFSYEVPGGAPGTLLNCKASALIGGTAKGGRTIDNMIGLQSSGRMVLFGYGNSNTSVINYAEYEFAHNSYYLACSGSVVLPSSMKPASWDNTYPLIGATELIPYKFNNVVGNEANGFIQNNWVYYPDGNGKICGLRFTSDTWKPIPDSTIISDDLALDAVSDSTYGPAVRSLWSLVGITDGGPPSSINWPVWNTYYVPETRPTELNLDLEGEFTSTVTTTSEDQYTEGGDIATSSHKGFSLSMKFAQSYKNVVSGSHSTVNSLSLPFELNEESQKLGVYIYVVPTITRYTYKRFPWWDPGFRYPVPGSKQYRFQTSSTAVIYRSREISEYPFGISEPNAANLNDWKLTNRTDMNKDVTHSNIQPICSPSWQNPHAGQTGTFTTVADTSSEYSNKTSYSAEASFKGKKPKCFESKVSVGHEVSYETSTANESKLSKKVEVSLKNMSEKTWGINFNSYIVHAYWFKPEEYDWWFYDSTGTDRPWYIGYSVSNLTKSINLLAPAAGKQPKNAGMLFSWNATGFEPVEYTLFICKSANITPSQTVFKVNAGVNSDHYLASPEFCEEGKTYYWSVRAVDRDGEITWSESRPFAYGSAPQKSAGENDLNAIPYPNPGTGKGVKVLVDTKETGSVKLTITAINCIVIYQTMRDHPQPGVLTIELPELSLQPGIYLLETRINQEKDTRKLVINP